MSKIVETAVEKLGARLPDGFAGIARFVIEGEGAVIVDGDGVRAGDGDADVTLTADVETFEAILNGDMDPTAAFMQGKLAIDGDMGMAMQLGAALS
ncbi:MAG: SCP2 sterol-binding domain-containing protein [Rhodobacteraceae bacterium]|nr:SCP2 sterol-binding domain-containing protein [Paracoccaceae bacterium]MCP5340687.1 SCP2 sterol-binding domain-containing protein [Paracoccaceae bacterium]